MAEVEATRLHSRMERRRSSVKLNYTRVIIPAHEWERGREVGRQSGREVGIEGEKHGPGDELEEEPI